MVKSKCLILLHCGIEIISKNTLVCGKGLFNLGVILRKLNLKGLTVRLLESSQIDGL